MIYCPKCGSDIPEHGNFCPECGALVRDDVETLNNKDEYAVLNKNHYNDVELFGSAECLERFNLSPAEFMTLIHKPKYLDNYIIPPYRITLFYFILKDILELEIRSSNLILFNLDHVVVKRGQLFEKSLSAPFKPYESSMLYPFRSKNSFHVDTYESGPLSYKFEKGTFKNLFLEELLNLDYYEYKKRSIAGFGAKEYALTAYGDNVRETILSELDYDLKERILELDTPADYLYILSFFGLDEGMMQDRLSEIKILHRKLWAIERAYERRRRG